MRKHLVLGGFCVVLLLAPCLAFAGGGGGIEYVTNPGPDILGSLLPAGSPLLRMPTGTVQAVSGFGYGVTYDGWKIGGFGTFFTTGAPLSLDVPTLGTVTRVIGGFGGIISGGQGRLGPLLFSVNLRLGAGGMGVGYLWYPAGMSPIPVGPGTFALFGSVDAEVGLITFPAMAISAYAGVNGILALGYAIVPVAVPTMGVRITWGSF